MEDVRWVAPAVVALLIIFAALEYWGRRRHRAAMAKHPCLPKLPANAEVVSLIPESIHVLWATGHVPRCYGAFVYHRDWWYELRGNVSGPELEEHAEHSRILVSKCFVLRGPRGSDIMEHQVATADGYVGLWLPVNPSMNSRLDTPAFSRAPKRQRASS